MVVPRSIRSATIRTLTRGAAFACAALVFACAALVSLPAYTQQQEKPLADLSLEELSRIEVTSVSRRTERLVDAAASIFVVTQEDIRRSGVTSLAEALRLAPNLLVARTSASGYAISARGFNNSIGNKLLVLIDGRIVYTPLFSGVFWDSQDVMLEDVDRIEVISGPGATLWGANAVNGVINVITRPAGETQGGLAYAGVGTKENGVGLRFGGTLDSGARYRVYGKFFDRDHTLRQSGVPVRDAWHRGQVGFRVDWKRESDGLTLQGDAYDGSLEQAAPGQQQISGANLLARWDRKLEGGSSLRLQAYYDRTERDIPGTFSQKLDTFDVEFQHALAPGARHNVIWGGGYRYANDAVQNSAGLAFLPAERALHWANVFIQDEIALQPDLRLTLGAKVEHNDYTKREFLPGARLAWKPTANTLLWGALSRAVRAPARLDRDLFVPAQPPFVLAGGPNFRSEVSNTLEAGYSAAAAHGISYSVTVLRHEHDRLRSIEPGPGGVRVLDNKVEGTTSGIEAWGTYQPRPGWRLSAGALLLRQRLRAKPDSLDPNGATAQGNDPDYQVMLRSGFDLGASGELDVMVRRVGALPSPPVPAYTAVDVNYSWALRRDFRLSFVVQNLFDKRHPEFGTAATRSEIGRAAYLKATWQF